MRNLEFKATAGNKKAAILENDPTLQKLIASYLNKIGYYDIVNFSSGEELLDQADESFDIFIIDWKNKPMPGKSIFLSLKKNPVTEHIPIVLISGFINRDDIYFVRQHNNTMFLVKPFTEEVLVGIVKKLAKLYEDYQKDQGIEKSSSGDISKEDASELSSDNTKRRQSLDKKEIDDLVSEGDSEGNKHSADSKLPIAKRHATKRKKAKSIDQLASQYLSQPNQGEDEQDNYSGDITAERENFTNKNVKITSEGAKDTKGYSMTTEGLPQGSAIDHTSKKPKLSSTDNIHLANDNSFPDFEIDADQLEMDDKLLNLENFHAEDLDFEDSDITSELDLEFAQSLKKLTDEIIGQNGNNEGQAGGNDFKVSKDGVISSDGKISFLDPADANWLEGHNSADQKPRGVDLTRSNAVIAKKSEQKGRLYRALVVEKDVSTSNLIKKYLMIKNITEIKTCKTARQGCDLIQTNIYDIVVLDWSNRDPISLTLYNRIRLSSINKDAIIIAAGNAGTMGLELLEESPLTAFVKKPIQEAQFFSKLTKKIYYINNCLNVRPYIDHSVQDIVEKGLSVDQVIQKIFKGYKFPIEFLIELAQKLIPFKKYSEAERSLLIALQIDKRHVGVLTLLGKVYHHLNKPERSMALISRANYFSPQNVERLCLLGEVGITLRDTEKARDFFKGALDIDSDHQKAKAGMTLTQNIDEFLDAHAPKTENISHKISSMLNVIGITYIRNKEFKKGIEQYNASLCFITDNESVSKLKFNLGLAYLRNYEFEKASDAFLQSQLIAPPGFSKPTQFLKNMDKFRNSSHLIQKITDETDDFVSWESI